MATSTVMNTPSIVEQGTSGMWTYRKWSDGTAECWGQATASTTYAVWSAPIYYSATYAGTKNFPTGLFIAIPVCEFALISNSSGDSWLAASAGATKDHTQNVYALRVGSAPSGTYTVGFYAIGKWK